MARKKVEDDVVRVEDHVTPELVSELEAHARAGFHDPAAARDAPLPVADSVLPDSPAGNGQPAWLKGQRKPRDPNAPKLVYLVAGNSKVDGSHCIMHEARSLRGANRWCQESGSLLRMMVRDVRIYRAKLAGAFA